MLLELREKLDLMAGMGNNDKQSALASLSAEEQAVVALMLNPFVMFGVKKYDVQAPQMAPLATDDDVMGLLARLASRELTGSAAIQAVSDMTGQLTPEGQDMLRRFLIKNTKAKVGISLCNKAFLEKIPVFEVALAEPYKEKGDKYPFKPNKFARWPMIGQKKLDGMRVICLVEGDDVSFLSRTGNPVTTLDHLKPEMLALARATGHPVVYFDGEGVVGSFNGTISALRKKNVKAVGAEYFVFDWFLPEWKALSKHKDWAKTGMKLRDRLKFLLQWFGKCPELESVKLLPFTIIHSHEEYIDIFMKRLDDNDEGEMGKDPDAPYWFKRSRAMFKMKDEIEADGEIIGFEAGDPDSEFAHTLGKVIVRLENGTVVRASGIKHKYLDEIWLNQALFLGRITKVNAHEETPDGSLRHPRLKWPECLRDTEDRPGDKE